MKHKTFFYFLFSIFYFLGLSLASGVWAGGAELFLSPQSRGFEVGEVFQVSLLVDTAGVPINAAEALIYFPAEKLEVLSIS